MNAVVSYAIVIQFTLLLSANMFKSIPDVPL